MLSPLFIPNPDRPMRVAGFMSGSGTNLERILEREKALREEKGSPPFKVVVILTDTPASNAARIARSYGIPLLELDIESFYHSHGHRNKRDLSLRPAFDRLILERLARFSVDTVVLAGYMSIVTGPLLQAFPGRIINVHPADLRIMEGGKRKFTGDHAVRDAILAGEEFLRSSTHIVREKVDYGEVLMVSDSLPVELPQGLTPKVLAKEENRKLLNQIASGHQDRLKRIGDWVILPRTLEFMAQGRFAQDKEGAVYCDGHTV
jgi:folate-dependent phosphoribosylglycinamide formyltransferase PurN